MEQPRQSLGQKWSVARPTKTAVAWSCIASIIVTMIVGFTWGGWVTGGTALKMAEASGEDAVVKRLAPVCVVQFKQDARKTQKLQGLKETGTWEQADFVKKQGWATMPGAQEPDNKVAGECAKLLLLIS